MSSCLAWGWGGTGEGQRPCDAIEDLSIRSHWIFIGGVERGI